MVLTPTTKRLQDPHWALNQEEQKEETRLIFPSQEPEFLVAKATNLQRYLYPEQELYLLQDASPTLLLLKK